MGEVEVFRINVKSCSPTGRVDQLLKNRCQYLATELSSEEFDQTHCARCAPHNADQST